MSKLYIANPKFIFINREIKINLAIVFNKTIIDIGDFTELKNRYLNCEIVELRENTILMPGFINSHIHLEYSHIIGEYKYGSYISWLQTVFNSFKNLNINIDLNIVKKTLNNLLYSGTTTIGAISSRGIDLVLLAESPIRKIVFNEIIGSQQNSIEWATRDLYSRINKSEALKSEKFIPAIAIHSPFSVRPELQNLVIEIAKSKNYLISTHFLESREEREWLDYETGKLKEFYINNYGKAEKFKNSLEFLEQFKELNTIFAHGSYLTEKELSIFKGKNWHIVHSPVSNRVLDGKTLDINLLKKYNLNWLLATDGLSSNFSVSQLDEMRSAIFTHFDQNIHVFAKNLILASTIFPAKALALNNGEIAIGKDSDMIFIEIDKTIQIDEILMHIILRNYMPYLTFIFGSKVIIN
jgi:cytosine/adenosine deaminase-related metal-dependent hydrolase